MSVPGLVIGTAGHIDHGKTSLVRTLTGIDLDALPEERARGITIALGFTSLELSDGRMAALVDVPGHERLVRTMISGATGIDAVILCVSAVDGVMPQTREHLAILSLLGVQQGGIVLTMSDLVDPELLELAAEDAADAVAGTFLENSEVVPFSSVTGNGRDALLQMIRTFRSSDRQHSGPFRLPVDRTFTRPGFGTVATGTVWSGSIVDGTTLQLLPQGTTARVRGLQVHGDQKDAASAGQRAALNLAGMEVDSVPRGTVLVHGDVPCTQMIDAIYRHLPSSPPFEDDLGIRLLLGTAECIGHLHIAEDLDEVEPGDEIAVQFRLESPLPCLPGDRFIVRRVSPLETLGGGIVVDPWAPRLRRKNRTHAGSQIRRLHDGEQAVWLERAGEDGLGEEVWQQRTGGTDIGEVLGDRRLASPVVARLEGALIEALTEFHTSHPISVGAQLRELRRGRLGHLSERAFDGLINRLAGHGRVVVSGPLVRMNGFAVQLTATQKDLKDRISNTLRTTGLEGILPKDVHKKHPEDEVASLLRLMELNLEAEQINGIGWVAQDQLNQMKESVSNWFSTHDQLETSDFKSLTSLSRRAAIPLLEWLDKTRVTRREANHRVPGASLR